MNAQRTIPYRVVDSSGETVSEGERVPNGEIVVNRKIGERLYEFVDDDNGGDWVERGAYAAGPVAELPPQVSIGHDPDYAASKPITLVHIVKDGEVVREEAVVAGGFVHLAEGEEAIIRKADLMGGDSPRITSRSGESETDDPARREGDCQCEDCACNDVLIGAIDDVNEDIKFVRPKTGPYSEAAHSSILEDAKRAVYGERQAAYGHPAVNFQRIAALWNGYFDARAPKSRGIDTTDVAAMFALVKIARLIETPTHRDSWVDIAGYAEAGARAVGVDE